jgi:hypothetical protein
MIEVQFFGVDMPHFVALSSPVHQETPTNLDSYEERD